MVTPASINCRYEMKIISKLLLIVFTFNVFFFLSCRKNPAESETYTSYEWRVSTPEEQGFDGDILSNAIDEAEGKGFIVSLLIVRNSCLVAENYFYEGYDESEAYSIRSIAKSLVSALIGIALRENYIDSLNQRVLDFFPEFVTQDMDARKFDITIKHLLTMKAGFDRDDNVDSLYHANSNWIKDTIEMPLINDPGDTFCYSSMGAHLLSGIITKATGMSTLLFAENYLCEPLQISIRIWNKDPQGVYFGGGSMYLTPRDMARFGDLYLKNGFLDGKQIVPAEWVEESTQNYTGEERTLGVLEELGYGYLWWLGKINDYRIYFAVGYAGQYIINIPDLNMVIVTTSIFPFTSEMADDQVTSIMEFIAHHILPAVIDE